MDQPPFDRSPLDGYALRAADTPGAWPGTTPSRLQVVDTVYAGGVARAPVGPGQAVRGDDRGHAPAGMRLRATPGGHGPGPSRWCPVYQQLAAAMTNYCFAGERTIPHGRRPAPSGHPCWTPPPLGLLAGARAVGSASGQSTARPSGAACCAPETRWSLPGPSPCNLDRSTTPTCLCWLPGWPSAGTCGGLPVSCVAGRPARRWPTAMTAGVRSTLTALSPPAACPWETRISSTRPCPCWGRSGCSGG